MAGMISVSEALEVLAQHAVPMNTETVKLSDAKGRKLAESVVSRVNRPPASVSAMDGYAVRLADVAKAGARLKVIGEAPAGAVFKRTVGLNEAVRIFTGGVVPSGADHIVIQEDTLRDGDEVTCTTAYETARNIRRAGIDFAEGDELVTKGTVLDAAELAIIAAANHSTVCVEKRLRVGILANGDELREPGSELGEGQIVNSNPIGLAALMTRWGADPVDLGIASDSVESIRKHISDADDIDIFLPVGGASVGDHDHMRNAFAEEGFEPVFDKIAVKPGKPTWFAKRGNERVLGLPGNPASAFVCAHLFASKLLGQDWSDAGHQAILTASLPAGGRREEFLRARVELASNGCLQVTPADNQDSSLLRPFLSCNALIRRTPDCPSMEIGETQTIFLIGELRAGACE